MFKSATVDRASAKSSNSSPFHRETEQDAFIQPKLNVGKPNDKYEIEADRVADNVVTKIQSKKKSNNDNAPSFSSSTLLKNPEINVQKQEETEDIQEKQIVQDITPIAQLALGKEEIVQEKCENCQAEDEQVQTISDNVLNPKANIEAGLNSNRGKGQKLDSQTKNSMGQGFGTDFSNVNIHTNSNAIQMNQALGARAFTNGNDIYFNKGQYSPNSISGQHLLAHELTHTIQQNSSVQKKDLIQKNNIQLSSDNDKTRTTTAKIKALTPQQMWHVVLSKRGLESRVPTHRIPVIEGELATAKEALTNKPKNKKLQSRVKGLEKKLKSANNRSEGIPKKGATGIGKPLGQGTQTFAFIQVVNEKNQVVAMSVTENVRGGDHAEQRALKNIRQELKSKGYVRKTNTGSKWKIMIVVDQKVCKDNCRPAIRRFANDYGINLNEAKAWYPKRIEHRPLQKANASPKTTSRTAAEAGQITDIPKDDKGEHILSPGKKKKPTKPLRPLDTDSKSSKPKMNIAKNGANLKLGSARLKKRATLIKSAKVSARTSAKLAIKALPVFGVLISLKAAQNQINSIKQKQMDQWKNLGNTADQTSFSGFPSIEDLMVQHDVDDIKEEKDWIEQHGAVITTLVRTGANTQEIQEGNQIIGRALSNIRDYAYAIELVEVWSDSYADELKPLQKKVRNRYNAINDAAENLFKKMSDPEIKYSPMLLEVSFSFYFALKEVAQSLSNIDGKITMEIRDFERGSRESRRLRKEAIQFYNTWYKIYNNANFVREGHDVGHGLLEKD